MIDTECIRKIFSTTAFVRTGGSKEEKQCAEYLQNMCKNLGLKAEIETFEVPMYDIQEANLTIDGENYPCKGYFNSGNGCVEAPLYYLTNTDEASMKRCKDKIVLVDGNLNYWRYRDLLAYGALGFITYCGDVNHDNCDIDQKELRLLDETDHRILGVTIHARDAVDIVNKDSRIAQITLVQNSYVGHSQNIVLDLAGESEETVVFSAHYDTTALSVGAYDNMSGCIALLYIAEHFSKASHRYKIRLIWCGAEERGLLGSKAYCKKHKEELSKARLNINLDMIGCTMGRFMAFCTDDQIKEYLERAAFDEKFGLDARFGIRSGDSNSFADCGVPAVSFARIAPGNTSSIHCRYDTAKLIRPQQLICDMHFIAGFTERVANSDKFPFDKMIPDKIRTDLDYYFMRKR